MLHQTNKDTRLGVFIFFAKLSADETRRFDK